MDFTPFYFAKLAKLKFCKVAQWSEWTALFEVQCPILYWIEIWALSWPLQNIHLFWVSFSVCIEPLFCWMLNLLNSCSSNTESDWRFSPYFAYKSSRQCSWIASTKHDAQWVGVLVLIGTDVWCPPNIASSLMANTFCLGFIREKSLLPVNQLESPTCLSVNLSWDSLSCSLSHRCLTEEELGTVTDSVYTESPPCVATDFCICHIPFISYWWIWLNFCDLEFIHLSISWQTFHYPFLRVTCNLGVIVARNTD